MNLSSSVNVVRSANAAAVATTDVDGAVIDMQDHEGVLLIAAFGTITDGTPALKAQGGAASDGSDMADLAGTSTAAAIADDNKLVVLDVYKPLCRYIRGVVVRGGATGAVVDGIVAIPYGPKVKPTTNGTTVAKTGKVVSPAFA